MDFLHKILKDFVCIFSTFPILSETEAEDKNNLENYSYWLWPLNIKIIKH